MTEVLTEQLAMVTVDNNMFTNRKSALALAIADTVIPQTGELRSELEDAIGSLPVFEFVDSTLSKELHEAGKYDSESSNVPLTDIEPYTSAQDVASRLIDEFCSLPWQYTFTLELHAELSGKLSEIIQNYEFSEGFRLSSVDAAFNETYPLSSGDRQKDNKRLGLGLLSLGTEQSWRDKSLCLQMNCSGFVGYFSETNTVEKVKNFIKSFLGLCIALRVFKVNRKYRSTPTKAKIRVHRKIEGSWCLDKSKELDLNFSNFLHDLELHDLDGALDSVGKHKTWLETQLSLIGLLSQNPEKADRVLLACQWIFESLAGENELLAFIQATIVLEILLGEKTSSDEIGLSVLLRNRCAYLIGTSQEQREELLDDFKKIYECRSKVVHAGKNKLDWKERALLYKLQWMCRRVVQEEIKLLEKDVVKENNS